MTPEEMRERCDNIRAVAYDPEDFTKATLWEVAAEICDRLDRLLEEREGEGGG